MKSCLAKRSQDWSYRKFPAYPDWKDNKIRKFTVRKVCSGRKPRMWLNHFLLVLLKDQNGQHIQSTRGRFEEIRIVIQWSPQPSQWKSEIQQRWNFLERSVKEPFVSWTGNPPSFWECYTRETLPPRTEGNRKKIKWNKADGLPKFYREEIGW